MTNAVLGRDNLVKHKLTAAEVATACPAELHELARCVNVHLEKARKYQEKADQPII